MNKHLPNCNAKRGFSNHKTNISNALISNRVVLGSKSCSNNNCKVNQSTKLTSHLSGFNINSNRFSNNKIISSKSIWAQKDEKASKSRTLPTKHNNSYLSFILLISFAFIAVLLLSSSLVSAMANPAATYCELLKKEFRGYDYKILTDKVGNQYGVCILPNKKQVDEWKFFSGEVGGNYDYCTKKGYGKKIIKGSFTQKELACLVTQKQLSNMRLTLNANTGTNTIYKKSGTKYIVPVSDFLKLSEGVINIQDARTLSASDFSAEKSAFAQSQYDYWDWRNPPNDTIYAKSNFAFFDDARGWMTPVKNQGTCGSCYAFSALGLMESKYEIEKLNPFLSPDLSEEYLLTVGGDSCNGGLPLSSLYFIENNGTVDEFCLPYANGESSPANICTNSQQRLWNVSNVTYLGDITPERIVQYGPLSALIGILSPFGGHMDNGIYRCDDDTGINHAIVIVGFNNTGNISTSYWIVKNSWGAYNETDGGGYFKLGFGECSLSGGVSVSFVKKSNFNQILNYNNLPQNYLETPQNVSFNFTIQNRVVNNNATCQLYINNNQTQQKINIPNNSFVNFVQEIPAGFFNWNIKCWENELGIVSIIEGDIPSISVSNPLNNSIQNDSFVNINFSVVDSTLDSCWYNLNNAENISIQSCFSFSIYNLTNGDYSLQIFANDSRNNIGESEKVYFNINDTTAPNLIVYFPINGTAYNTEDILINFTSTSSDLKRLWWSDGTSEFNYTFPVYYELEQGWNNIFFYSEDVNGNINLARNSFLVNTFCPTGMKGSRNNINNPCQITNCTQLQEIQDDLSANYVLMNDIDCIETIGWNEGAGFSPAGIFIGNLNGRNHTINNLYINRPAQDYVGLFASIESANISNMGLENVNITGRNGVGAFAGSSFDSSFTFFNHLTKVYSTGTILSLGEGAGGLIGLSSNAIINNSYSRINILALNDKVGGLTGYLLSFGIIENSYSTGNISGSFAVGGLTGTTAGPGGGSVLNSFSTAKVFGGSYIGALVGSVLVNPTNSYWNNHSGNAATCYDGGSDGCTAIQDNESYFYHKENQPMASWDFDSVWCETEDSYPALRWEGRCKSEVLEIGDGTPKNPFKIYNCTDLQGMNLNLSAYYLLETDVDCSDINGNGIFVPIGRPVQFVDNNGNPISGIPFTGNFNGNNHTISNLKIKTQESSALFGGTWRGAVIKNLGVRNVSVGGTPYNNWAGYSAVLIGKASGTTIENVYVEGGNVYTAGYVGGLVGWLTGYSTIKNSYAREVNISGCNNYCFTGGLVGKGHLVNTITNTYFAGSVNVPAGGNEPSISCLVNARKDDYFTTTATNSFYNSELCSANNGYGTAKTTEQMKISSTYAGFDFTNIWKITEGEYPVLKWEA